MLTDKNKLYQMTGKYSYVEKSSFLLGERETVKSYAKKFNGGKQETYIRKGL